MAGQTKADERASVCRAVRSTVVGSLSLPTCLSLRMKMLVNPQNAETEVVLAETAL